MTLMEQPQKPFRRLCSALPELSSSPLARRDGELLRAFVSCKSWGFRTYEKREKRLFTGEKDVTDYGNMMIVLGKKQGVELYHLLLLFCYGSLN